VTGAKGRQLRLQHVAPILRNHERIAAGDVVVVLYFLPVKRIARGHADPGSGMLPSLTVP